MLQKLIAASPWPVFFQSPPGLGCIGQAIGKRIYIAPWLSPAVKCYVLLHEICHAVAIEAGLHPSFEELTAMNKDEREQTNEFAEVVVDLAVIEVATLLRWRIKGEHAKRLAASTAAAIDEQRQAAARVVAGVRGLIG